MFSFLTKLSLSEEGSHAYILTFNVAQWEHSLVRSQVPSGRSKMNTKDASIELYGSGQGRWSYCFILSSSACPRMPEKMLTI